MPITGLSHLTFVVRDLERSARLWVEGLGAEQVYDSELVGWAKPKARPKVAKLQCALRLGRAMLGRAALGPTYRSAASL
jgi:catechol 2,3-dioxygenase-like lactoylglutathione lyase family enzyme